MKLSLIFPVYNEEALITDVLEGFSRYCHSHHIDHELIVVNDGSTDATSQIVRELTKSYPNMYVIEHPTNLGYGAALQSGFAHAIGEYIFFTDSDGQFQADDLENTLSYLHPNTIIVGFRKNRADSLLRRFNAWLWSRCVAITLGVRVSDLNCAWKVFPRSMLSGVMLVSKGACITAELLWYAQKKNLVFQEIPIRHFRRLSGAPTGANWKVITRAFQELIYFTQKHHL